MPKKYPWKRIVAELRERPGAWRLFPELTGVPITLVNRVRRREARPLHLADGKIYARRGPHVAYRDERVITDVWLRFLPYPTERENHDEKES